MKQPDKHELERMRKKIDEAFKYLSILNPYQKSKGDALISLILKEEELHEMVLLSRKENYKIRYRVIEHLSKFEYQTSISDLIDFMTDEEPIIRKAAMRALQKVRSEYKFDFLLNLINDPDKLIRLYSIKTIGEAKQVNAVLPLLDILDDNDPEIRFQVIDALRYIGDTRADDDVFKKLKDPEESVRYAAAFYCGTRKLKKACPKLLDMSISGGASLRAAAVWAIGKIRKRKYIMSLLDNLETEKDYNVRNQIIKVVNNLEKTNLSDTGYSDDYYFAKK